MNNLDKNMMWNVITKCRATAVSAVTMLALAFSASEGSAQQKLCVSATGATRVVDATESCRKIETTVKIPEAVQGETVKTSSYLIPGSNNNNYLGLFTADGGSELDIYCRVPQVGWFATDPKVKAGDISIFNDISGQTFQAFNDLRYNGGSMDFAVVPSQPWTGTFIAKYGKSLSRFEVTVSQANPRGDCLVTVFSIGLGSAVIYKY